MRAVLDHRESVTRRIEMTSDDPVAKASALSHGERNETARVVGIFLLGSVCLTGKV